MRALEFDIIRECMESLINHAWPGQPLEDVQRLGLDCASMSAEEEAWAEADADELFAEYVRRIGGVQNFPAYLASLRAGDRARTRILRAFEGGN